MDLNSTMGHYLKKIYLLPWTLWCAVIFIVIAIITYISLLYCFIFKPKDYYLTAHNIPMWAANWTAFFWGIKIEKFGLENFDEKKQYIFVGNHRTLLDAVISQAAIRNPKKFIGKAEILNWPVMGFILRKLYIPVERDSKESRAKSMERMIEIMGEGYSMVVFAEGKTNKTQEPILPFKDGAFITSVEASIDIAPFVIKNADVLWPRNVWLISPGKVSISFLNTIPSMLPSEENIEILKKKTYDEMLHEYLKPLKL